jgi:hypothetical protein
MLVFGGAVVFLLLLALKIWNPSQRRVGLDELPDILRANLLRHADGGITRLQHRDSDLWFSFERMSGTESEATLALRIPHKPWRQGFGQQFPAIFESNGFDVVLEKDNASIAAKVLIHIEDIWEKSSGAKPTHAARLLLQGLDLEANQKFAIRELARLSDRYLQNVERF